MAYAPLDEHFDEHPKYEALELEHYGLMACAIVYCNRNLTDGKVSFKAVRAFGKSGKGSKLAKRLTDLGIWRDIESGWEIVGFLDHNPSREEVLAKREAARVRKGNYRKGATSPTSVPPSVPVGQDAGQTTGHDAGRTAGQTRLSHDLSLARAPAPAGGIRSTALHCTTIQEIPPTPPWGLGSIVVGPERPKRVVDMGTPRCQAACEAFVAALAARGWTRGEVREPWERRALCDAINAHLRADGSAEGVLSELRRAVDEWAQAFDGRQRFTSGWGARKFADWLAEGREPAPGTRGTVAAAPPVTSSEPEVYYPPPTPEEAAELERALANLGNPPPEAKSGARAAVGEDHTPAERAALEAKRQAAIALLRAEAVADAREAS